MTLPGLFAVIDTSSLPRLKADNPLTTIVNLTFGVVAAITVLVIVISGFRFIVAHGDPSAVAKARESIIYALVGLGVTLAAFSIVTLVVKGVS